MRRWSTLEAATDLCFWFPFGGSTGEVSPSWRVVLQADDDGAVERGVGLAVSTAVESVASGPGGGGDRRDAAQFGPAASERTRSGLSPATMRSSAAVSGPTPKAAVSCGAWAVVNRARTCSWDLISVLRCCQRRAMARRVWLVAAANVVTWLRRSPAQRSISHLRGRLELLAQIGGSIYQNQLEADHRRCSGPDGDVLGDL